MSPISDKLVSIFGVCILVGLIGGSWFPQPCPFLRRELASCPATGVAPLTPQQQELARIPHQDINATYAQFAVKSDADRAMSAIRFSYLEDSTQQAVYLQAKEGSSYVTLGTVRHPLLTAIGWSSLASPGFSLFQREQKYSSFEDLADNLPPGDQLLADEPSVRHFNLAAGQYRPLEDASSLTGVLFVLTAYAPPIKDGSWSGYDRTYDLSEVIPDSKGMLNMRLYFPNNDSDASSPVFRLGTVHVDYAAHESPLPSH